MSEEEKKAIEKLRWYFEGSQGLDITNNVNIVLDLAEKQDKEIETYKKIAETLVDFIMSCYESRMYLGIITGLEEKITFEDVLDWAKEEVLKKEGGKENGTKI